MHKPVGLYPCHRQGGNQVKYFKSMMLLLYILFRAVSSLLLPRMFVISLYLFLHVFYRYSFRPEMIGRKCALIQLQSPMITTNPLGFGLAINKAAIR